MSSAAETSTQTCYRHPTRETGVTCSSCGRPICPDCMTPTPVGMRCPECSRQRTQVRTLRSAGGEPRLTVGIIVVCVIAFLGTGSFGPGGGGGSRLFGDLALFGPAVADGEVWRLVTSGFLHAGIIHIAFNMYLLWVLGNMLEPALGTPRFGALYATALLWGSFGALLVEPNALTVGASGAIFGILGAAFVLERQRTYVFGGGALSIIVLNVVFTFAVPGISIGGHLGGLIGGAVGMLALSRFGRGHAVYGKPGLVGVAGLVGIGVLSLAVAFWASQGTLS